MTARDPSTCFPVCWIVTRLRRRLRVATVTHSLASSTLAELVVDARFWKLESRRSRNWRSRFGRLRSVLGWTIVAGVCGAVDGSVSASASGQALEWACVGVVVVSGSRGSWNSVWRLRDVRRRSAVGVAPVLSLVVSFWAGRCVASVVWSGRGLVGGSGRGVGRAGSEWASVLWSFSGFAQSGGINSRGKADSIARRALVVIRAAGAPAVGMGEPADGVRRGMIYPRSGVAERSVNSEIAVGPLSRS